MDTVLTFAVSKQPLLQQREAEASFVYIIRVSNGRLVTVLVQHAHDIVSVTQLSCFRYEGFVIWALPKMIVLILVFW